MLKGWGPVVVPFVSVRCWASPGTILGLVFLTHKDTEQRNLLLGVLPGLTFWDSVRPLVGPANSRSPGETWERPEQSYIYAGGWTPMGGGGGQGPSWDSSQTF